MRESKAFVMHAVLRVCPTCVLAHVWFELDATQMGRAACERVHRLSC